MIFWILTSNTWFTSFHSSNILCYFCLAHAKIVLQKLDEIIFVPSRSFTVTVLVVRQNLLTLLQGSESDQGAYVAKPGMLGPAILTVRSKAVTRLVTQAGPILGSQLLRNIKNGTMEPGDGVLGAATLFRCYLNSCKEGNYLNIDQSESFNQPIRAHLAFAYILSWKQALACSWYQWLFHLHHLAFIRITDIKMMQHSVANGLKIFWIYWQSEHFLTYFFRWEVSCHNLWGQVVGSLAQTPHWTRYTWSED